MDDYFVTAGLFIVCRQPKQPTFSVPAKTLLCGNCDVRYDPDSNKKYCSRCGGLNVLSDATEEVKFTLSSLLWHFEDGNPSHPLIKFIESEKVVHFGDEYEGDNSYIALNTPRTLVCPSTISMSLPFITKEDITKAEKKKAKLITALKCYYKSVKVEYLLLGA